MTGGLRILIVSESASAKFGGEAALPLHYFRVLRARGFAVWLITHERTRRELEQLFPAENRILYVRDTAFHKLMNRLSGLLPPRVATFTLGFASRFSTQLHQRRMARELVLREGIDVVHQPMPVSPREPSLLYGIGAPVVIGPMNGGMDYPPGFALQRGALERVFYRVGRWSAGFINRLIPGKRRAAILLVANERTRHALPAGVSTQVRVLVENGVDLGLWQADGLPDPGGEGVATFVFMGRLVDWKAVDLLLYAFQSASTRQPMRLLVIGDGIGKAGLESLARGLGILARRPGEAGAVTFCGWRAQQDCARALHGASALVLPSLYECGGAVVLEAMCAGRPVIATDWGGPADYLDPQSGILVPPTDRDALVKGFAEAMVKLAGSPALGARMGEAGRRKVHLLYDWERKVDRMLDVYREAVSR